MRDEGRPFEVGNQVLISSHRKLLSSKAMVVNVAEKSERDFGRLPGWRIGPTNASGKNSRRAVQRTWPTRLSPARRLKNQLHRCAALSLSQCVIQDSAWRGMAPTCS